MTTFNLRRYVAKETAVGIVVNLVVSTAPGLILMDRATASAVSPVRDVALGLTPQFFIAALMSALVPSLLVWWRQGTGRLAFSPPRSRLRAERAVGIAIGLALVATVLGLAVIHVVVAPSAAGGMDAAAILALRGAQAALAAATVTPVALLLFLGTTRHPRSRADVAT